VLKVGNHKVSGGVFLDIFYSPTRIRQGIGKKLISLAFVWCREKQISRLHVSPIPMLRVFMKKWALATGRITIQQCRTPFLSIFKLEP
jgi:hypothetical protein